MSEYLFKFQNRYKVTDDELAELQSMLGPDLENFFHSALSDALILLRLARISKRLDSIENVQSTSTKLETSKPFWDDDEKKSGAV